jgi:hypothetical protein
MQIGPRTGEYENHVQHFWRRQIGDTKYRFVHVKVSRLGHPWIAVSRADTGELVRCSCRRDDCPFTT